MPDPRPADALDPSTEPDSDNPSAAVRRRYLGKYRGTVVENEDPMQQGRLVVAVPDLFALFPRTWAMPCLPMAYVNAGIYVRPVVGAGVWVEFEQGDPDYAIWVGGYWDTPQSLPLAARTSAIVPPDVPVFTVETETGGLSISDTAIGPLDCVCLRSGEATITLGPSGIKIVAPQVSITTPAFSVNGVALTVSGG
jgi:Type VI secretion system/phage-baseplate injector OB domain